MAFETVTVSVYRSKQSTDERKPVIIDHNSFHEETDPSDHSNRKSRSDSIPWPAFKDLAPSKLTKTASTLMAEWEQSLTPSPERVVSPKAAKAD
ncbi:dihydrofolate reductase [Ascosphaera pollenicola]|nr:dihydrofolate reductase [Ascosphaera pollenicola]